MGDMNVSRTGTSSYPTVPEMVQEARKRVKQQQETLKKVNSNGNRYGEAPRETYSRLARARNKSQVNAAAGYARRQLAKMRSALRQDSENSARIRGAIIQLQKSLVRAEKKKKDLDREKRLETQRAKAEQEEKEQKAQRLRQELRQKQKQRSVRESGYLREAEVSDRLHTQLTQTQMELRSQAQSLSAAASPSPEYAAQQYAACAQTVEVPVE